MSATLRASLVVWGLAAVLVGTACGPAHPAYARPASGMQVRVTIASGLPSEGGGPDNMSFPDCYVDGAGDTSCGCTIQRGQDRCETTVWLAAGTHRFGLAIVDGRTGDRWNALSFGSVEAEAGAENRIVVLPLAPARGPRSSSVSSYVDGELRTGPAVLAELEPSATPAAPSDTTAAPAAVPGVPARDACAGVTCSNHGICTLRGGDPACACYDGYAPDPTTGLSCQPVAATP